MQKVALARHGHCMTMKTFVHGHYLSFAQAHKCTPLSTSGCTAVRSALASATCPSKRCRAKRCKSFTTTYADKA